MEVKQQRFKDPELASMARMERILTELDPPARTRVLAWLEGRENDRRTSMDDLSPDTPERFDANC